MHANASPLITSAAAKSSINAFINEVYDVTFHAGSLAMQSAVSAPDREAKRRSHSGVSHKHSDAYFVFQPQSVGIFQPVW